MSQKNVTEKIIALTSEYLETLTVEEGAAINRTHFAIAAGINNQIEAVKKCQEIINDSIFEGQQQN